MADDIDRIVAGLTAAQVEMLSGGPCNWRRASKRQVRGYLTRKGLLTEIGRLTPLGLAVRARLLEMDHG